MRRHYQSNYSPKELMFSQFGYNEMKRTNDGFIEPWSPYIIMGILVCITVVLLGL